MAAHIEGLPGVEIYNKPSTGQWVMRKTGVQRSDEGEAKVLAKNIAFASKTTGNTVAKNCAKPNMPVGRRYKAFKACLRMEGYKLFHH